MPENHPRLPGAEPPLYLASASPRRLELLRQIGVRCTVLPMDIDESRRDQEKVADYVSRLAIAKARAAHASRKDPACVVLGADTAVYCCGEILTKPTGSDHAVKMLQLISGSTHQVYTGTGIVTDTTERAVVVETCVTMTPLTVDEINHYVATGEPFGKAGAYAIQGRGAMFIEHIEGSYSNVVGLPLFETAKLLSSAGINVLSAVESAD